MQLAIVEVGQSNNYARNMVHILGSLKHTTFVCSHWDLNTYYLNYLKSF